MECVKLYGNLSKILKPNFLWRGNIAASLLKIKEKEMNSIFGMFIDS